MVRIIGIDPGLRNMGWGVIDVFGNQIKYISCGSVKGGDAKMMLSERLLLLYNGLRDIFELYKPEEAAVENTFVNKDGVATLKLGQARAITLLVPAIYGLNVAEYAPNNIKKTIIGAGHADKQQIQKMVKFYLPKVVYNSHDSADALAIALCHAYTRRGQK